jgi:hypothetical protein
MATSIDDDDDDDAGRAAQFAEDAADRAGNAEEVSVEALLEIRGLYHQLRAELDRERGERLRELEAIVERQNVSDGLVDIGRGVSAVIDALGPLRQIVPVTTTLPLTTEQAAAITQLRSSVAGPNWGQMRPLPATPQS